MDTRTTTYPGRETIAEARDLRPFASCVHSGEHRPCRSPSLPHLRRDPPRGSGPVPVRAPSTIAGARASPPGGVQSRPGTSSGSTDNRRTAAPSVSRIDLNLFERAAAAQELHALSALETLDRADRNHADRPGARDVRAAAGRQVEAVHVDQPQRAFAGRFLAKRQARPPRSALTKRIVTGWSSQTTRLASASARGDVVAGQLAIEIDRGRRRCRGES